MVYLGVELDVGGETTPEDVAGAGTETEGEFTLKHEDGAAPEGTVGEEFEY